MKKTEEAQQVFRQFAWHLAGKLVQPTPPKGASPPGGKR